MGAKSRRNRKTPRHNSRERHWIRARIEERKREPDLVCVVCKKPAVVVRVVLSDAEQAKLLGATDGRGRIMITQFCANHDNEAGEDEFRRIMRENRGKLTEWESSSGTGFQALDREEE
jgi:hypothetical protein